MTTNKLATQTKRDIAIDTSVWTPADIKRFFDPQNLLTEKQVGQALSLIKGRNLNPLADEVYIVAYKNRNGGTEFSLIVSKEAFMKRANQNKHYKGFEAGIVVTDETGVMVERKGALKLPSDELVGGWARVYRDDFEVPVEIFVSMDEYNKNQSTWKSMPATMIRKVALVNALREAFPEDLGNMYTEDDGGETFDRIRDVTPTETQEEVRARRLEEARQAQQQLNKPAEKINAEDAPLYESTFSEPVQGELLDEELEY